MLVGGNCGVYEGAVVREGAVLAAGNDPHGRTPVYDLVRRRIVPAEGDRPLESRPRAVVVPGRARGARRVGPRAGLSIYTPLIVKYRD